MAKVVKGLLLLAAISSGCCSKNESVVRDPSFLKLLFRNPSYNPEPYTYPGPSPSLTRLPNLYPMYVPPRMQSLDLQALPKWCENMWEREECGMKCWMLRKICWNMVKHGDVRGESTSDSEASSTVSYPYFKPPYYPKKAITYSATGVPNMYYAQPSLHYPQPYYKRYPYSYYRKYPAKTEFGLNPQFTYVDDEKPTTTTTTTTPATNQNFETTTESSEKQSTTERNKPSAKPQSKEKIIKLKGPFGVKVTYPPDSEVATLSPLMFDYDQHSGKKYYGDRIYMSTVIPVSDRKLHNDDSYNDFGLDDLIIIS